MKYSPQEIMQFVREEDVKFIRLAFCDVFGRQKNISVMPSQLVRAFSYGITIDASAIDGFGDELHSDLVLHPDASTLAILPWRPDHGRVIRMYCDITYPDGRPFECDTRTLLKKAVEDAKELGIDFSFGAEMEFYLFKLDENGNMTDVPYDDAGYMDIAPEDKGENVRREICLSLEQMDIIPESSHHEAGPGQNEINFRFSDPVSAADNATTYKTAVKTVAGRNGLFADFSPKPIFDKPGNGFHINISAKCKDGENIMPYIVAGVLDKISEITAFLNPTEGSYERFGKFKAPKYISWSSENRSQLVRKPAADGEFVRAELRSPDPMANPYLAFTLIIYAGLYGLRNGLKLPPEVSINLFTASQTELSGLKTLPLSKEKAVEVMKNSDFIKEIIPDEVLSAYC